MKNIRNTIKGEIENLEWDVNPNKIVKLIKNCIKITTKNTNKVQRIGKSKFGGKPDLPEGYDWPEIQGIPLAFIGQINFSELESFESFNFIFRNRIIYFFFSVAFEHYQKENQNIHKTFMIEIDENMPPLISTSFPKDLKEIGIFKEIELEFSESFSFPSYHHWQILSLNLSDNDEELLEETKEIIRKHTTQSYSIGHQLFGFSEAIQGDTNLNWARKHKANQNATEDIFTIQKQFELLLQIDADDKESDFNKSIDGGVYYGYKESEKILIQCELQNT